MKWKNLLIGRCPKCGKDLSEPDRFDMLRCIGTLCTFIVAKEKLESIVESLKSRPY